MRTVKGNMSAATAAAALAASLVLLGLSTGASAQVAQSDYPAGYVVLPKIVVHTTGGTPPVAAGQPATDTIVQMTNTNQADPITVDCWWVNANKHCTSQADPNCENGNCAICDSNADCPAGLQCIQGWAVADFQVTLTPGQPIGFTASTGLPSLACDPMRPGPGCNGDAGGSVRFVPEDPFRGELKCVQVDPLTDSPVLANDLKIEASIVSTTAGGGGQATTAAAYNGVGFQTLEVATAPEPTAPLCLVAPGANPTGCGGEYAPCPGILIAETFFDYAPTELGSVVTTELTLTPCSEDLAEPADQANLSVATQMLIYNEFEQRFSTSTRVNCYQAVRLSDIDTPVGPTGDQYSIFNVGVQGTITGQTRIRGVSGSAAGFGYGLIGVACENHTAPGGGRVLATSAFNLNSDGYRSETDFVYKTQFPQ